jgi:hypothetical protein
VDTPSQVRLYIGKPKVIIPVQTHLCVPCLLIIIQRALCTMTGNVTKVYTLSGVRSKCWQRPVHYSFHCHYSEIKIPFRLICQWVWFRPSKMNQELSTSMLSNSMKGRLPYVRCRHKMSRIPAEVSTLLIGPKGWFCKQTRNVSK